VGKVGNVGNVSRPGRRFMSFFILSFSRSERPKHSPHSPHSPPSAAPDRLDAVAVAPLRVRMALQRQNPIVDLHGLPDWSRFPIIRASG
jgi:hypothetical protein